jgi:gluconokinase
MILILMGVSGAGKTTVGQLLAKELGWPFYDGDDFHPPANIDKMSRGVPLTDEDRAEWLVALRQHIERLLDERQSAIIACSALKASYREQLKGKDADVQFVYLRGDYDVVHQRLQERHGHFMKSELLQSQFAALEEPNGTGALMVEVGQSPADLVSTIRLALGL